MSIKTGVRRLATAVRVCGWILSVLTAVFGGWLAFATGDSSGWWFAVFGAAMILAAHGIAWIIDGFAGD